MDVPRPCGVWLLLTGDMARMKGVLAEKRACVRQNQFHISKSNCIGQLQSFAGLLPVARCIVTMLFARYADLSRGGGVT